MRPMSGNQRPKNGKPTEVIAKEQNSQKRAEYLHNLVRRYFIDAPEPAPSLSSITMLLGLLQCGGDQAVNCFHSAIGTKSLLGYWDEDMPLRYM